MTNSIFWGSKEIIYSIQFSERRTLGITVTPELNVLVKAPLDTPLEKISEKVLKRATWIQQQQNYFLTFYPKMPEKQYISGETHLYLGRQFRLQITLGTYDEVKYKGRYFQVVTKDKTKVKKLLKEWYKARAKEKIAEIAEPIIERFKKYNVEPLGIYIQEMETRWGSCTKKGRIILNPDLIKAPIPCVEYIITHELCHLVYYNHSQKFLALQSKEMPDWEKWKNKLEKLLA